MKSGLRGALWIGFGLFAAQHSWVIFNTYVPIFLQAGAPDFDTHSSVTSPGFGLSTVWTGVIMAIDNFAALILQPFMGPVSDQTRTRWGRRLPYLIFFIPTAALGMALIPIAPQYISPDLNGQIQALGGLFALFMLSLFGMVISMAIWRTPVFALMADVTPSALRSHANGVLNLMAGVGGVIALILGSLLYKAHPVLPFWMAALCMLGALALIVWKVREPRPGPGELGSAPPNDLAANISLSRVLNSFRQLPTEHHRPLFLLAIAVFCYMMGFHPIEAFFSSYGVNVLGLSESDSGLVLAAAYITFILFAVPSGMIAGKIGRRRTMQTGLVLFTIVMSVAFITPVTSIMVVLLGLGGLAWALIDVNGLPMILDVTHTNDQAGTYAGIYFAATTLAAIAGPVINGLLIDLTGRNYSMIFLIGPVFFILSIFALMKVREGEAHL